MIHSGFTEGFPEQDSQAETKYEEALARQRAGPGKRAEVCIQRNGPQGGGEVRHSCTGWTQ